MSQASVEESLDLVGDDVGHSPCLRSLQDDCLHVGVEGSWLVSEGRRLRVPDVSQGVERMSWLPDWAPDVITCTAVFAECPPEVCEMARPLDVLSPELVWKILIKKNCLA